MLEEDESWLDEPIPYVIANRSWWLRAPWDMCHCRPEWHNNLFVCGGCGTLYTDIADKIEKGKVRL